MSKFKEWVVDFGEWSKDNYMVLVYGAGVVLLPFLFVLAFSLIYGYWSNGLYGTHFELSVGFSGVTVLATAAATIYGIANQAAKQYSIDSELNSEHGKAPTRAGKVKG